MSNDQTTAVVPDSCPFCGGDASVHHGEHSFFDAAVRCSGCSAEGPMFDIDDGNADESGRNETAAIAAWNSRASTPPQPASRGEGEADKWRNMFIHAAGALERVLAGKAVRGADEIIEAARHASPPPAVSAEDVARAMYEARPGWVLHPEERPIPWDEAQTELAGRVATCREDAAVAIALFQGVKG